MVGPNTDWDQLGKFCAEYNCDDEVFDTQDVVSARIAEFSKRREMIETLLGKITDNGTFHSWVALYQPAIPGVRGVRHVIEREQAAPYREECDALASDGVDYFRIGTRTAMRFEESPSRKLSYNIEHPADWERSKVGTSLSMLLSNQRRFLVAVLPLWSIGNDFSRTYQGLDLPQTFQLGRDARDVLEDIGGSRFQQDDDGRYDNLGEAW